VRVAVTGATGLIGRAVVNALAARGDTVLALSRDAARARTRLGEGIEVHEWPDPTTAPPPAAAIEQADAIINLLGEPIAQRWSESARQRILDSRILSTRRLVEALEALPRDARPAALISQSAVGYYGPRGEEPVDEAAAAGNDFPAQVTAEWERAAQSAPSGVRVVLTRTGLVLASNGGALEKMLPPFRLGLGGPLGSGRQYMPWIHLDDTVGGLLHVLDDERASGPVNLTAPEPVTNRDFSRTLGRVLHRPAVLPVPAPALKLLFGEMATILLTGQRAVPARLHELGYLFQYRELAPALEDVLGG
jgi:uncharacterized protein (TIGR01777 family)